MHPFCKMICLYSHTQSHSIHTIMDKKDAVLLAQQHIDLLNSVNPQKAKFNWELSEPKEINGGWYFDYEFNLLNDEDIISIEGAPGFLVKTEEKSVEDLSWDLYHQFNLGLHDQNRHWL